MNSIYREVAKSWIDGVSGHEWKGYKNREAAEAAFNLAQAEGRVRQFAV